MQMLHEQGLLGDGEGEYEDGEYEDDEGEYYADGEGEGEYYEDGEGEYYADGQGEYEPHYGQYEGNEEHEGEPQYEGHEEHGDEDGEESEQIQSHKKHKKDKNEEVSAHSFYFFSGKNDISFPRVRGETARRFSAELRLLILVPSTRSRGAESPG